MQDFAWVYIAVYESHLHDYKISPFEYYSDQDEHSYKHRGPGFDSRALLRIFLRELGL